MTTFIIAVSINIIGIIGAIVNAALEATGVNSHSRDSNTTNWLAVLLSVLVIIAFILRKNGYAGLARAMMVVPAIPVFVVGVLIFIMLVLKPDFR